MRVLSLFTSLLRLIDSPQQAIHFHLIIQILLMISWQYFIFYDNKEHVILKYLVLKAKLFDCSDALNFFSYSKINSVFTKIFFQFVFIFNI